MIRLASLVISIFVLTSAVPSIANEGVPTDTSAAGFCETTLIGTQLRVPEIEPELRERLNQDIAIAEAALQIAPDREESFFWLGRRLGYAARYCDAIDVFTQGLKRFPDSYRLLRYRGRHLTRARQFTLGLADYERAMQLMTGSPDSFEPDGLPNPLGLTLGTYKSNIIYYHAQTSFAVGDYERMVEGMAQAYSLVPSFARQDMLPPTAFWTYLAYRKMGKTDQARRAVAEIPAALNLTENHEYHRAVQLFQGRVKNSDLTENEGTLVKFALAMELRFAGDESKATTLLRELVTENAQGFWPAEVELMDPERS